MRVHTVDIQQWWEGPIHHDLTLIDSSDDDAPAGTGMEIAVALATIVVAQFTDRPHQSGEIDWHSTNAAGQWDELLNANQTCAQEAATAFTRRKRRTTNDETRRAARALQFVQWGELSARKQAPERAELAPGNKRTLDQLRRRPDVPREAIPELARGSPMFDLDENVQS